MSKKLLVILLVVLISGCLQFSQRGYISGSIDINGTAQSSNLKNYTIEIGSGMNPENYTYIGITISNSTAQVIGDVLGTWNTSTVMDGNYTIRLSVTDTNNVTSYDYVYVVVDNIMITSPDNDSDIRLGSTVEINGTVAGANFSNYIVEHGYGELTNWSVAGITLANNGTEIVDKGLLATWNTSAVSKTGYYVIKLIVNYTTNQTIEENVTIHLNNYLTGWPKYTTGSVYSSPALADLDGDNDLEIVIGNYINKLYAWHHNGSNFMETINGTTEDYALNSSHPYNNSFNYTWNITKPGYSQIAVHFSRIGTEAYWDYVYILNASNHTIESFTGAHTDTWSSSVPGDTLKVRLYTDSIITGWGFSIDRVLNGTVTKPWPKDLRYGTYSSPAIGDIDGDNNSEIVIGAYKSLYVFELNGSNKTGWPQTTFGNVYSSPSLGDLDNDNDMEIVAASSIYVYAWHNNGSLMDNWPQNTLGDIYSSPALADLDGDNDLEIVIGSYDHKVYVWHHNGSLMNNWPRSTNGYVRSSPAIGDLDLDGNLDIAVGSYDNKVYAWHSNGSLVDGWPRNTSGDIYSSPTLADLDSDNYLEIIVGSYDDKLYIWHHNGSNFMETINGTAEDYSLNSSHPYNNSFDYTWNITKPGYSQIAVHFDRIAVERSYDYLYILNASNHVIDTFTGDYTDVWSSSVLGDTIKVRLDTDSVISWWGFSVDRVINGTVSKPWPKDLGSDIYSSPAVGDLDGDGEPEIVIGSYKKAQGYHINGSSVEGWPKKANSTVYSSPSLNDVDNDGDIDVVMGSNDYNVYIWDETGPYNEGGIEWGMFRHDLSHTGTYTVSKPNVTLHSPQNNAIVYLENTTFYYTPSSDVNISNCSLYTNVTGIWQSEQTNSSVVNNTQNSFHLTNLTNGTYIWNVKCTNVIGQYSFDSNNLFTVAIKYPIITNITVSNITNTSAIISWVTDDNATSTVEYGETIAYGSNNTNSTQVTNHTILLTDITPGRLYHFRVYSTAWYNATSVSADRNFTTTITFSQVLNFTAGQKKLVNASSVDTTLEITTNNTLTNITVIVSSPAENPTGVSFGVPGLNRYLQLNAPGLEGNASSILLKTSYTEDELNQSYLNASTLGLYWFNQSDWERLNETYMDWVFETGVNESERFVWANISHMSTYAIGGQTVTTTRQLFLLSGWNLISVPLVV